MFLFLLFGGNSSIVSWKGILNPTYKTSCAGSPQVKPAYKGGVFYVDVLLNGEDVNVGIRQPKGCFVFYSTSNPKISSMETSVTHTSSAKLVKFAKNIVKMNYIYEGKEFGDFVAKNNSSMKIKVPDLQQKYLKHHSKGILSFDVVHFKSHEKSLVIKFFAYCKDGENQKLLGFQDSIKLLDGVKSSKKQVPQTVEDFRIKITVIQTVKKIFYIFIISLLAGFIMNFMPCSLPMLGIRLRVISGSGASLSRIRFSMLGTSLGIISCFVVVGCGGMLLGLLGHVGGTSVTFSILQKPMIIATFMVLFFALLQIQTGVITFVGKKSSFNKNSDLGFFGGFVAGFVMTIFNTACLAPMFTSILTLSAYEPFASVVSAASIGFGFSTFYWFAFFKPNISLAFNNSKLGIILSKTTVPFMALTVLWFANILINQIGMLFGLVAIFILLIGVFILKKVISLALKLFVLGAMLSGILYIVHFSNYKLFEAADENAWSRISEKRIEKNILKDKVVLAIVTADWCITCKINKYTTWNSKKLEDFFKNNNIILMKDDITVDRDDASDFVKSFGNVVPLTILFSKKHPAGRVLNSILTPFYLMDEIEKELTFYPEEDVNVRSVKHVKKKLEKGMSVEGASSKQSSVRYTKK